MIPVGRLRGRVDRLCALLAYLYFPITNVGGWLVIDPQRLLGGPSPENLLLITDQPSLYLGIQPLPTTAHVLVGGTMLVVLLHRLRIGSALYRYAIAPMWAAGVVKISGNLVWAVSL